VKRKERGLYERVQQSRERRPKKPAILKNPRHFTTTSRSLVQFFSTLSDTRSWLGSNRLATSPLFDVPRLWYTMLPAWRTGHRTSIASAVEGLTARRALTCRRSLTWGRPPSAAGITATTTAIRLLRRRLTTGEEDKRKDASEQKFLDLTRFCRRCWACGKSLVLVTPRN
jgi:hypothetical protein